MGSSRISNSSKFLFMSLLPARKRMIRSKSAEKAQKHRCSHFKYVKTPKGSYLCSRWSDLVEVQSHTSSNVCHPYLQVCKGSDQKQPRKCGDAVFSISNPLGVVPGLLGPKPFRPGTPRPGRFGPFIHPGLLGPL